MNNLFRKDRCLMLSIVLLFASASFAQTTSMSLTGVGDSDVVWGPTFGVFVDPYTATVGGVANTSVICDDWSNNSYVGESWTANVTTVSSLGTSSTPMFGTLSQANNPTLGGVALTQAQLYDEVAWLGTQLLANPTNYANQVAVSFALWELTYNATGSGVEAPAPSAFLAGSAESGLQSTITTLLANAQNAVLNQHYNGAGWEILTPNTSYSISCSGSGCPSPNNAATLGTPQEFLVYTPESSAVILFGTDMFGLLGLIFLFRRRLLRPVL